MRSNACSGATCLALQVSSANHGSGLEIAEQKESDVITRRMQFRMKRDRKTQQQKKKADKEAQKIDKEKAKEEKKKCKEEAKKAKADQKMQKQKEKQDSKAKNRKKRSAEEIAQPDQVDQPEEVAQNSGLNETQEKNTKAKKRTSRGAKRSKLQRLHRMSAGSEKNGFKDAGETTRARRNKKSRKADVLQETEGSAEDQKSKSKSKPDKTDIKTEPKKPKEAKAKAKSEKKEKEKAEPCPRIMKMIKDTCHECTISECSHPSFEHMDMKGRFTLSIYWSRLAVGVKMLQTAAKGKSPKTEKSKGQMGKAKWSQVAYFACKSQCIYTNMVLAHEFATWFSS